MKFIQRRLPNYSSALKQFLPSFQVMNLCDKVPRINSSDRQISCFVLVALDRRRREMKKVYSYDPFPVSLEKFSIINEDFWSVSYVFPMR